jgi:hypothetical protein
MRKSILLESKAEALQRKADNAKRQAATYLSKVNAAKQAASDAEATEQQAIEKSLERIRTANRHRNALEHALLTIGMRYNDGSSLGKVDIKTFTILVERLSILSLRNLNREIPKVFLDLTSTMELPSFWTAYHQKIRESSPQMSKRYFIGKHPPDDDVIQVPDTYEKSLDTFTLQPLHALTCRKGR